MAINDPIEAMRRARETVERRRKQQLLPPEQREFAATVAAPGGRTVSIGGPIGAIRKFGQGRILQRDPSADAALQAMAAAVTSGARADMAAERVFDIAEPMAVGATRGGKRFVSEGIQPEHIKQQQAQARRYEAQLTGRFGLLDVPMGPQVYDSRGVGVYTDAERAAKAAETERVPGLVRELTEKGLAQEDAERAVAAATAGGRDFTRQLRQTFGLPSEPETLEIEPDTAEAAAEFAKDVDIRITGGVSEEQAAAQRHVEADAEAAKEAPSDIVLAVRKKIAAAKVAASLKPGDAISGQIESLRRTTLATNKEYNKQKTAEMDRQKDLIDYRSTKSAEASKTAHDRSVADENRRHARARREKTLDTEGERSYDEMIFAKRDKVKAARSAGRLVEARKHGRDLVRLRTELEGKRALRNQLILRESEKKGDAVRTIRVATSWLTDAIDAHIDTSDILDKAQLKLKEFVQENPNDTGKEYKRLKEEISDAELEKTRATSAGKTARSAFLDAIRIDPQTLPDFYREGKWQPKIAGGEFVMRMLNVMREKGKYSPTKIEQIIKDYEKSTAPVIDPAVRERAKRDARLELQQEGIDNPTNKELTDRIRRMVTEGRL